MKMSELRDNLDRRLKTYGDQLLGVMVETPDGKTYLALIKGTARATIPGLGQLVVLTTEAVKESIPIYADPNKPEDRQPWLDP